MKKIIIMFLLGTLIISSCSLYGGTQTTPTDTVTTPPDTAANPTVTTTPPQPPATTPDPATVTPSPVTPVVSKTVNIQNFAFNPATLTIKKGATITWVNNDSAPHQIKSGTFNSSQLSNGQSFSFTFDSTGTFDYLCSIHPSMTGTITVE